MKLKMMRYCGERKVWDEVEAIAKWLETGGKWERRR